MAELVNNVQIQDIVGRSAQVRQTNDYGTVFVIDKHLIGMVHYKHPVMSNDLIDFFRSGKDRLQNTVGADIRKNFFQTVLPRFQPAIDAKNIFHQDSLPHLAP